jgi:phosphohistidine phosphatase
MLAVLRHAKSSWAEAGMDDFDRPLNERGRAAARRIGQELKRRGVRFDHVIASPAIRVRETLDQLANGYGGSFDVLFDQQVYGAPADSLLELIRRIPAEVHAPLLVGHNPGLQQLILELASDDPDGLRSRVRNGFPTAAVAVVELPAVRWSEVRPKSGVIRELILPSELDG